MEIKSASGGFSFVYYLQWGRKQVKESLEKPSIPTQMDTIQQETIRRAIEGILEGIWGEGGALSPNDPPSANGHPTMRAIATKTLKEKTPSLITSPPNR